MRKISGSVGVERIFPLNSPNVDKIEVIRRGRVRRAKLYYLRNLRGKAARIEERRDERRAKRSAAGLAVGGPKRSERSRGAQGGATSGQPRAMIELFAEAYRLHLLRGVEELALPVRLRPDRRGG